MSAEVRRLRMPSFLGGRDEPDTMPAHARHHGLGHAPDTEDDDVRRWREAQQPKQITLDELARKIATAKAQRSALVAAIETAKQQLAEHDDELRQMQEQLKARTEHLLE